MGKAVFSACSCAYRKAPWSRAVWLVLLLLDSSALSNEGEGCDEDEGRDSSVWSVWKVGRVKVFIAARANAFIDENYTEFSAPCRPTVLSSTSTDVDIRGWLTWNARPAKETWSNNLWATLARALDELEAD